MVFKKETIIKTLPPIIGFGIGGALWGWSLYVGIPETSYPLTIPGAIFLGFFGGLGLSIYSKDIKKILKSCGLGLVGCLIGVFIAFLGTIHLPPIGGVILSLFFPQRLPDYLIEFFDLMSGVGTLSILYYWPNFAISGIFIGLFFSFGRSKILPMVWRGGVGFGLAAIISPLFGNLLGNLFNSLFFSYLITFSLIGVIFSLFLLWGISKSK